MSQQISKVYTYWPKNGAIYHGTGMEDIDLSRHDPGYAKLGKLSYDASKKKYGIAYGAKTKQALIAYNAKKKGQSSVYQAALNDSSIDHINSFTLMREMVGTPAELNAITFATRQINVSSLTTRIPERDAFKAKIGIGPLEEVDFGNVRYGEDHFDLKYNGTPFFHPTEDRMKGVIDPINVDLEESQRALREAREGLALFELTKLTAGSGLSDMEEKNTGGSHVANPKREIVSKIRSHWKATQSRINWTIWNSVDFERYESNSHISNNDVKSDAQVFGVVPLPKVPGVMAAVSPIVPLGTVYFVDRQAFLRGEGPTQTEQWRRPENNADLGIVRDYVQFLLMNPARYGFKESIDLTTSGDTAEAEPTSIDDIRNLVGNPDVAVNPPKISGS